MAMSMAPLELKMAAINAVIVVPMLAPSMKGAAFLRLTMPFATKGTTSEVVIVLERIVAVVIRPQPNDLSRFLKKNF
jgi:hypothetical protein